MNIFYIIFIIACVILAFFGFKATAEIARKKQALEKKLEALPNFTPQKTLIKVALSDSIPKGFSIDPTSQQICLIHGEALFLIPFTGVIDVHVIANGKIVKSFRGRQKIDLTLRSYIFGGEVDIILKEPIFSDSTLKGLRKVSLQLVTNQLDHPIHDIDFIELGNEGSTRPKTALAEANQWFQILQAVLPQDQAINEE